MKQRILRIITSMLLIMTLTMANFLTLCVNAVSYASEIINLEKDTNHKNVEFMAYFKDEEGNKLENLNAYTDAEDLKIYFQISVKKEGYFNGSISLGDSNFKFKTDKENDNISKIENNIIYLNQINAGDSKELEIGIQLIKDEKFDLRFINMNTSISMKGIYRDRTEKDIAIKSERNVNLNFLSPYKKAEENIILTQEVITNKIINYSGEDKRIVQIKVESGIKNNLFPIEKTIINIQAPKIADKYPEIVLVNTNNILVSNGKTISQDDWNYNNETGLININISNEQTENKISWIKDGQDEFIVTYIFDKDIEINEEKLNINSRIEFYDEKNTVIEAINEVILNKEEKNNIVTSKIEQNETKIYKGKLYAGISREITYKNNININLDKVTSEISILENQQKINEQNTNLVYKTSKIAKSNIERILAESASLNIINAKTGKVISEISKSTEANQNGDIVILYPENVETIIIKVIGQTNIGEIEIENTKTITTINKNLVKKANSLTFENEVSYISNNVDNKLNNVNSKIDLLETETSADLEISRTELSAMVMNNNVEFRITLNSKNENDELYNNPVIKLELPEKIEKIEVNYINLLYENEMKIKSAVLKGKTIEIVLNGEQTQYKDEAINGAIIIINANLGTSIITPNSLEQVKLTYTNNNVVNYKDGGIITKDISIISFAGVVATNEISEYGVQVVNDKGINGATLDIAVNSKNAVIEKKIINNKENKISNVKILGTFPTKEATKSNNIDIEVGDISILGINSERVKIYYSENENATVDLLNKENNWTESIINNKNVKKYLVEIEELNLLEEVDLTYEIIIPENLENNKIAQEGYTVYYTNVAVEEKVESSYIKLETPKGVMVETKLNALLGGIETTQVKEHETLRYEVVVSNTGSEDISNLVVKAKVPEGTTYLITDKLNKETTLENFTIEDKDKKEVKFNIDKLSKGEQIIRYYEVTIDEGMAGKEILNSVVTEFNDTSKTSNEISTKVDNGDLKLTLVSIDAFKGVVTSGFQYRYVVLATNKSNEDMENVNLEIKTNDVLEVKEIYYLDLEKAVENDGSNNIKIEKIKSGETMEIILKVLPKTFNDTIVRETETVAIANVNGIKYTSNEVNNNAEADVLLSIEATSENSGQYVKAGDTVKYKFVIKNVGNKTAKTIELNNWFSNYVTVGRVLRNGIEISDKDYVIKNDNKKNMKVLNTEYNNLESGESVVYEIEAVVNLLHGNTKVIEIVNESAIKLNYFEIFNSKIQHILEPEKIDNEDSEDNEDNKNDSKPGDEVKYQIISGTAWMDENEDGKKDTSEKTVEGIVVKLLDATTNKFVKDANGEVLTAKTTSTGFYNFNKVEKGKYIVIFEYDTTQYGLTTFEKEGLTDEVNSNVITKNIDVEGNVMKVAATEVIEIIDSNISNIDIGLITAKKYDLQLDKYISKITVQNNKTVTENYNGQTLVKKEIDAKQVNSTIVVVEYTIKVTNNGDVAGYVKKIADYLSKDYKFNSELNKDWYQSGDDLYCTSLANEKIEPGESREVELTVIKEMNENNIGLINNTAEIVSSYNELGLTDINSTEGNRIKDENDMGSADLIISIRTGQVVMTVTLTILAILVLFVVVVLLKKYIIDKKFM